MSTLQLVVNLIAVFLDVFSCYENLYSQSQSTAEQNK